MSRYDDLRRMQEAWFTATAKAAEPRSQWHKTLIVAAGAAGFVGCTEAVMLALRSS